MNEFARMLITITFGWLGLHKFLDKKPLQGFLYIVTFGLFIFGWIIDIVYSIQCFRKKTIGDIKKTSKTLGIIFSLILLIYCFGSLGTEDFSRFTFFLCLISAISIVKIYIIDNNITYEEKDTKRYDTYQQNREINDFDDAEIIIDGVPHNISENKKFLTGSFYNENLLIMDKYRNLNTPNYVLTEIDAIIYNKNGYYYNSESVVMSYGLKEKYIDNADFFPYGMYWASINNFDEHQLKWYLYWRKEFLNKNILDTDYGYILAFARELINYTFNDKASFNISVLEYLYSSYKDLFPEIERYIPRWINDMLSETGYFYNKSDSEIKDVKPDLLLLSLTHDVEKDKISISRWRTHYNERKSDLTNKEISLISDNQKYNNRFKKYAGLLAKYYIESGLSIEDKWFRLNIVNKKERLFDNVNSPIERMQGTFKYKEYQTNEIFEHDMNQITKLCYDLLYPQGEMDENAYVINQYQNGKYELPEDFFYSIFKKKSRDVKSFETDKAVEKNEQKEFLIDISKINDSSTKIEYIEKKQEKINLELEEKEFVNTFENGILDRKTAQLYCVKKGKMLNAYINSLNEKYFPIIHKELIIIDNDFLRLNTELEEISNDK